MYHTPKEPTSSQYRSLKSLHVDVEKGKVYKNGREQGWIDSGSGYHKVWAGDQGDRRVIKRANIVWWKATGSWPKKMLNHKNTDRTDDRLSNLEYTTNSANSINNVGGYKSTKGLPRGVTYLPKYPSGKLKPKPYNVTLIRGGKKLFLGSYATVEEAEATYKKGVQDYEHSLNVSRQI